jgi:predicted porin
VKRTFISAAAILAFTAAGHADELSDIQAQAKQLRDQNQALMKRLSDIEKRQKALETQQTKQAQATVNPVDSMAADLPYKAVVAAPINDDLCWHGVCLYGNFDMGIQYMQHGSPSSPMANYPLNSPIEKAGLGSQFLAAPNQASSSFLGLRGKQEVADNLYAVFNLQTLFNPASGMNSNGIGAIVQNNGLGQAPQLGTIANAYGDSSKAGQMFNNAAYFGVSSPVYGTFTMGRQSALSSDLVVNYDALSGSNAWSLIVNEGATGGSGVTENRIYDNSYEYRLNVGPVRLAAEAQLRNGLNSSVGNAFEGDIGFDYMGLSMDFLGSKQFDQNSVATTLTTAQVVAITSNQAGTAGFLGGTTGLAYAIPCSLGCLSGTISDTTAFAVGLKYTFGPVKFYGGYERLSFANPSNPLQPGANVTGGYNLAFVNNNNYISNRNQDVFWVGVKYAVTPTLDIAASYYGIRQHSFIQGAGASTTAGSPTLFRNVPGGALNLGSVAQQQLACATNPVSQTNCAGGEDMVGLMLDWRFARHFDLYAGIAYSQRNGGLASGFVTATNNGLNVTSTGANNGICFGCKNTVSTYDPGIGLRYQF